MAEMIEKDNMKELVEMVTGLIDKADKMIAELLKIKHR